MEEESKTMPTAGGNKTAEQALIAELFNDAPSYY
jgi:hypothetical protein